MMRSSPRHHMTSFLTGPLPPALTSFIVVRVEADGAVPDSEFSRIANADLKTPQRVIVVAFALEFADVQMLHEFRQCRERQLSKMNVRCR